MGASGFWHFWRWLRADSNGSVGSPDTFRWAATNKGQVSSFAGNYTLQGNFLELIRSGDGQKLAGTFTPSDDGGFVFQLQGVEDSGIKFASL